MDFRSIMIQGVDGEFNFLPEGGFDDNQGSFSAKSVNNKTPIIDAEPISVVLPSNGSYCRARRAPVQASKVAGDALTPLDVDSDPDIHEFPFARELKNATDRH
ncbi:hypothetical protein Tco_1299624 [Tanacetum coccineum]